MAMEAIWFTHSEKLFFNKDDIMKNMQRLRILCMCYDWSKILRIPNCQDGSNCHDGSIESLFIPNNLRWFVWHNYPWKLFPQNFNLRRLVHLDLQLNSLLHLWNETKQLPSLRRLDLSDSQILKRTPDFTGMPNLEHLNLMQCRSLEEVHHSLGCSRKLIELNLYYCDRLERLPYVNAESLESLNLFHCSSLEKFPEIVGIMKQKVEIKMSLSGIRELPLSINHALAHFTELDLSRLNSLVALPSSICNLKGLVKLHVSDCSKLESLPEEIGDLKQLEELDASYTLISRPPSSIVRLNKLKFLTFAKRLDGVCFVFPQVNEGLHSLERLNLSYCNLIDGGLPEDIGSLSSLEELDLSGNNFEHLPRSIAHLNALRSLDLSHSERLTQLPEFPQQLDTIHADWKNDSICNSLFQNISSLQHDISASDSLSLRVLTSTGNIPRWFHHREGGRSISVKLPENWYVSDNFLGFAVCYDGKLIDAIAHLICYDERPVTRITQKLALSNPKCRAESGIHFFLVPLTGLLDKSKANGKTPNDYGRIRLFSTGAMKEFGLRLIYKDKPKIEASCSSSKKQ